jgi:hypothetical protein
MTDRWGRLAPLTGVLFAVLAVVAVFTGGETPEANASAAKVIAYFGTHRSEVETSNIMFALAFIVVVLFAGALRSYVRSEAEGLGALILVGAAIMSVGAVTVSGVEYGLAHHLTQLSPSTAQTLNVLTNELGLPILAGAFVFAISSGLAILRGANLPKWLGWVAIVLAIAVLIPPIGFPALLGFVIWSIIVSILMYRRTGAPADTGAAAPPATAQPAL